MPLAFAAARLGRQILTLEAKIEGFCDPKYDRVKKQFEKLFTEGVDENAQLCVYVEDKCIIDLYGTYNDEYNADKTQVSHAKSIY